MEYLCDIILVTYNGLDLTKKCIESVEKNTKDVKYRFVFVDNNSTDGTIDYLKNVPNSLLISNSDNKGFVKAMNQGFEKVSSKYCVWLNNDTIVTPDWLKILINHLQKNSNAAAIGPLTNGTGLIQREDSWNGEIDVNEISQFGAKFHKKNNGKVVEYHRIAGFCIVMKSELISKIGKLDEDFNFGGYDDDDYCKRIRDSGYKILIAEDVFIYHKSGATFSSMRAPELSLPFLMQKGRRRLLRKWIPRPEVKASITEENEPLVSIIMATKDREKIIPNAINCVINQTYKNWELIIVNDGGTDLTDIIKKISDDRIQYIPLEENEGKSHANNVAIKSSNGKIIAYLDDDDRWFPNHLEVAVRELTKYQSRSLVYTDYVKVECLINESGRQVPSKKVVMELKDARDNPVDDVNFIPNLSTVHKKELFNLAGNFDEGLDYYEDWDILRRFSKYAYFVHIPEITGEYWINQLLAERNAKALMDRNLDGIRNYIKNKTGPIINQVAIDLGKADRLVKKDQLGTAFKHYKKILEKDPDFYPALEGCADRQYNLKKYDEANVFLEKLIKLKPYSVPMYFLAANSFLKNKDYKNAKKYIEYGLLIKDEKGLYYLLQECYNRLGNNNTAEFIRRKTSVTAENINLQEVEEFLINLFNKNIFYRKLFTIGYKILKKLHK